MTTDFFSAKTQYHPMHEADTLARAELDVTDPPDSTAPLPRASSAPRATTAGWLVSGLAALIGVTTFSIVGAYALDEFTSVPSPRTSATAPDVVVQTPHVPTAPPKTSEMAKPVEPPHVVVVVPAQRSAPPVQVSAPAAPTVSPAPSTTTPPPPPPSWHHPHQPSLCHLIKCPSRNHDDHSDDGHSDDPSVDQPPAT